MNLTHITKLVVVCTLLFLPGLAGAQIFDGGGLQEGLQQAAGLGGIAENADIRTIVINVLNAILSFLALLAVIAIIVAGLYLILGFGSDDSRTKAKNIILYTIIALVIILFARVIVSIFTRVLPSEVS